MVTLLVNAENVGDYENIEASDTRVLMHNISSLCNLPIMAAQSIPQCRLSLVT
jgi:hypothetical protein